MNPAACTLDVVVAVEAAVMAKGRTMTSAIGITGQFCAARNLLGY
jgi:hypothetical protein